MKDGVNVRRAQILKGGLWQDIEFMEIKPRDTFRLFEPEGQPVKDNNGLTEFVAKAFPKVDSQGVKGIEVEQKKGGI